MKERKYFKILAVKNNVNFTTVVLKLGSSTVRSKNSEHDAAVIITT